MEPEVLKCNLAMPLCIYLIESVDLLPIGCESHETCCQVNQATNH